MTINIARSRNGYLRRGAAANIAGDTDRAIDLLERALVKDASDPAIRFHLSLAEFQRKNTDAAVEQMFKSLELDSTNADAYYDLALMFEKQRNLVAAHTALAAALYY